MLKSSLSELAFPIRTLSPLGVLCMWDQSEYLSCAAYFVLTLLSQAELNKSGSVSKCCRCLKRSVSVWGGWFYLTSAYVLLLSSVKSLSVLCLAVILAQFQNTDQQMPNRNLFLF